MTTTISRMLLALACISATAACTDGGSGSDTNDIFRQDAGDGNGNARRHKATAAEMLWTVSMGGCTGHLLSPDYMMTAAHCTPAANARYRSGSAIAKGQTSTDITVQQVVELDPTLDYAIMKISWAAGAMPKDQRFPPLVATDPSDVVTGTGPSDGDALFTVGFPGDKTSTWGVTYAEGFAKEKAGDKLVYNIGIINGNSGGGVWRKKDNMLVSLTNGGPHVLGAFGWDTSDVADANAWNYGVGMWNVYAASATLRDIFPNGRNRYAKPGSGGNGSTGAVAKVFAALGDESEDFEDTFDLSISAPQAATTLKIKLDCGSDVDLCGQGPEAPDGPVRTVAGSLAIFNFAGMTLVDGMTIEVTPLDAKLKPMGTRKLHFAREE
jgi:V8-like Glu-specific endopeptidase